jgi:Rieske Fe-S protein
MKRRTFLVQAATPLIVFCAACSKSSTIQNPSNTNGVDFTINLNNELLTVGSSVTRNGVIVVRIATTNLPDAFIAFQVECTHAANPIIWNQAQQQFNCNLHGSVFSKSGAVVNGPANRPLKAYTINVSGLTLRITD